MIVLAAPMTRGSGAEAGAGDSPGSGVRTTSAALPSPKRLLTTAVRMVSSMTYAAEQTSIQTRSATRPGCAAAHAAVLCSAFAPALQPMPTTSSRLVACANPICLISRALKPGVRKPVEVTQHRCATSAGATPARLRAMVIACSAISSPTVRCLVSRSPCDSGLGRPVTGSRTTAR
jgi:hypothetical protein